MAESADPLQDHNPLCFDRPASKHLRWDNLGPPTEALQCGQLLGLYGPAPLPHLTKRVLVCAERGSVANSAGAGRCYNSSRTKGPFTLDAKRRLAIFASGLLRHLLKMDQPLKKKIV